MNLIVWSAKLGAEVGGVSTGNFFKQFVSIRALTFLSYPAWVIPTLCLHDIVKNRRVPVLLPMRLGR